MPIGKALKKPTNRRKTAACPNLQLVRVFICNKKSLDVTFEGQFRPIILQIPGVRAGCNPTACILKMVQLCQSAVEIHFEPSTQTFDIIGLLPSTTTYAQLMSAASALLSVAREHLAGYATRIDPMPGRAMACFLDAHVPVRMDDPDGDLPIGIGWLPDIRDPIPFYCH